MNLYSLVETTIELVIIYVPCGTPENGADVSYQVKTG